MGHQFHFLSSKCLITYRISYLIISRMFNIETYKDRLDGLERVFQQRPVTHVSKPFFVFVIHPFINEYIPRSMHPHFSVAANETVAQIQPSHQHASRRRTDCRAGIEVGEPHAFIGHAVEFGRFVDGRAERPDIAVAHVVDEDEHDVRRAT